MKRKETRSAVENFRLQLARFPSAITPVELRATEPDPHKPNKEKQHEAENQNQVGGDTNQHNETLARGLRVKTR